jgi:hypothetical protein
VLPWKKRNRVGIAIFLHLLLNNVLSFFLLHFLLMWWYYLWIYIYIIDKKSQKLTIYYQQCRIRNPISTSVHRRDSLSMHGISPCITFQLVPVRLVQTGVADSSVEDGSLILLVISSSISIRYFVRLLRLPATFVSPWEQNYACPERNILDTGAYPQGIWIMGKTFFIVVWNLK